MRKKLSGFNLQGTNASARAEHRQKNIAVTEREALIVVAAAAVALTRPNQLG
jgi:hypothetical protein